MNWFFPDRKARSDGDRYLPFKIGLFVAGAAAALLGIALGQEWLVTSAIAVLAVGVLLRLLPRGSREPPPTE
jgi:hypothetical protein